MSKSSHIRQVLANKGDAIDETGAGPMRDHGPDELNASGPSRLDRIRLAAYAAAERRGFVPGHEESDWLEAERQVDAEQANAQDSGEA